MASSEHHKFFAIHHRKTNRLMEKIMVKRIIKNKK